MDPTRLNGKKVIGTEGFILGEIEGVDVDSDTWQVSTLYVGLSNEAASGLGLRKSFFSKSTICLPIQFIKSVGDLISLNEPIRNLEEVATKECLVKTENLKGRKVVGAKGYVVGEVESLDVDPSNWQVTDLQVSLSKDAIIKLGLNKPLLRKGEITIPTDIVSSVGNMITLNDDIQDLKALEKRLEQ